MKGIRSEEWTKEPSWFDSIINASSSEDWHNLIKRMDHPYLQIRVPSESADSITVLKLLRKAIISKDKVWACHLIHHLFMRHPNQNAS